MAVACGQVIDLLEEMAPSQLQADWDNSGLQAGSRQWPADNILLALDITPDVMEYAVVNGFGFIFSHHPLIFKKLSRVDASVPMGKIISKSLQDQITIYAMHTNLDMAKGGVSDVLARLLNLEQVEILARQQGDYYKLAVFVPETHMEQVRKALGDAGAGAIGKYSHCSFASPGRGCFLPGQGAEPWLGRQGKFEEVDEYKLETLVESYRLGEVLAAMRSVHPYEEIAYDLLPMANEGAHGLGRVGILPVPVTLAAFADLVGIRLGCSALKVSGDDSRMVQKVAVCGGSGGNLAVLARRKGADVLVTGDIDYHDALEAKQLGLALIDPGHYCSEYPILNAVENYLKQNLGNEANIVRFPGSTDPLRIKTVKS